MQGRSVLVTMVTPPKKGGRSPYAAAHTQATMGGNRTDEALLELSTLVLANCQPALPLRRSICAGWEADNNAHSCHKASWMAVGSGGRRL